MKALACYFLDFTFPTFCLHCDEKTFGGRFCSSCSEYLTLSSDASLIFEESLISDLYLRYLRRYQFRSDIKTVAAYVVLKLDSLNESIPEKIFGNSVLTNAISKQVCFFYQRKSSKQGKKVLQIQEKKTEKGYSIFLLMT